MLGHSNAGSATTEVQRRAAWTEEETCALRWKDSRIGRGGSMKNKERDFHVQRQVWTKIFRGKKENKALGAYFVESSARENGRPHVTQGT